MEIRCVKAVYTLGDGRRRVTFTDGTTTNLARLVGAVKINRPLLRTEVAHHRNGDCGDDRLENIEVLTNADHSRWHGMNPRPRVMSAEARHDVLKVRFPDELYGALKTMATENERSLNAEIIWRLRRSLQGYRQ